MENSGKDRGGWPGVVSAGEGAGLGSPADVEVLTYERADSGVTDARLQAFLAGEHASPPTERP